MLHRFKPNTIFKDASMSSLSPRRIYLKYKIIKIQICRFKSMGDQSTYIYVCVCVGGDALFIYLMFCPVRCLIHHENILI